MSSDFRYLYLKDENKFPHTCVAFKIDRNTNKAFYGVSTVHPNDKGQNFDRKIARELAVGRLVLDQKNITFPTHQYNSVQDIMQFLIYALDDDKTLPKRTQRAIAAWIANGRKHNVPGLSRDDFSQDAFETYQSVEKTSQMFD